MTPHPIRRSGLLFLAMLTPLVPLRAEEPGQTSPRELLRDALYAEEVTRDATKAAEHYAKVLELYEAQQPFAATALFRLAEVRRKQGNKEEAAKLYQRLLREFPGAEVEGKLAQENLTAMGAAPVTPGEAVADQAESNELARLKTLAKDAPDALKDTDVPEKAAQEGWARVMAYLIDQGNDPYRSQALDIATNKGYLNICRLILDRKGMPPEEMADEVISDAVLQKRPEILKFYLERGFDVNRPWLLGRLAKEDDWEPALATLLIARKANPDRMPETTVPPESGQSGTAVEYGTPLHNALMSGNVAAANFLLDHGSKPDLPTPDHGITPLHLAIFQNAAWSEAMVKRLLDAGADPNRITGPREDLEHERSKAYLSEGCPLDLAIGKKNNAMVRLLLGKGAKPGSDPVLATAISSANPELLELLLREGVRDPQGADLYGMVANNGNKLDQQRYYALLLDGGVVPPEKFQKAAFGYLGVGAGRKLNQRYIYPALSKEPQVTLLDVGTTTAPKVLQRKTGEAGPGDLLTLVAPSLEEDASQQNRPPSQNTSTLFTIVRAKAEGGFQQIAVDLAVDAPLPALQWGDIVEWGIAGEQFKPSRTVSQAEIGWLLQKDRRAKVSVEIAGEQRELTLRGDLVVHAVGRKEVPYVNAGGLVDLLWQPESGWNALEGQGVVIVVTRAGWPELRLAYPGDESSNFKLQDGDRLKLEIPENLAADLVAERKNRVTVRVPGTSFNRFYGALASQPFPIPQPGSPNAGTPPPPALPAAPTLPTLVQVLTDLEAEAVGPSRFRTGKDMGQIMGELLQNTYRSSFTVLPFPDLAKARILRRAADGSEQVITPDLTKAIAATNEVTAPEAARAADVQLQAGDIVELPLRADKAGDPWKGYSLSEEAFFAKVLRGRVQMMGTNEGVTLKEISYKAPSYVETPGGWVPQAPEAGTPGTRVSQVLGNRNSANVVDITRGEESFQSLPSAAVFLRDGDQVRNSPYGQVVPQTRPPRPRVQPPSR